MPGREFAVEPDRWALPRRPVVHRRGSRVSPGPLKALPRRRSPPTWLMGLGLGLAGVTVAAAFTLAPRPAPPSVAEPSAAVAPNAAVETPSKPRVVGAAVVPPPAVAPAVGDGPATDQPALRGAAVEPAPTPPEQRRVAAPALDVGALPVLELDASAFEAPPVAEAPRAPGKQTARPVGPRPTGQN